MKFINLFFLLVIIGCVQQKNVTTNDKLDSNNGTVETDNVKQTINKSNKELNKVITHRYTSGKPSVIISKWENYKRTYTLYNLKGEKTYSLEEVRSSYSVRISLQFHDNGAVKKIIESTNPGGSMYMTKATTTVSTNNTPQWRTIETIPAKDDFLQNGNPSYYWNLKTKKWTKQEIIEEQPVLTK